VNFCEPQPTSHARCRSCERSLAPQSPLAIVPARRMACPNVRRENPVVFGTPRFYYLEHDQVPDDPLQKKAMCGGDSGNGRPQRECIPEGGQMDMAGRGRVSLPIGSPRDSVLALVLCAWGVRSLLVTFGIATTAPNTNSAEDAVFLLVPLAMIVVPLLLRIARVLDRDC
jgi:hypothetical protein